MNSRLDWNQILTGDHEHTAGQAPAQRFRCNCCGMGLRPSVPSNTARSGMTDAHQYPLPFLPSFDDTPLASLPARSRCQGAPPACSWLLSTAGKRPPPQHWHRYGLRLPSRCHLPAHVAVLGLNHLLFWVFVTLSVLPSNPKSNA